MLSRNSLNPMGAPAAGQIGQLVRLRRIEAGLSQRELAKAAGLTNGAISMIERGLRHNLRFDTIGRIANVLQIDLTQLGVVDNSKS
jgi:transcriptional regulator with XRE-family HTH domain